MPMKMLSASALARNRNLESRDLFKILVENNWIYKKDEQWQLTKEGRMAGGETNYNPKFGEYIVWPINLDLDKAIDYKSTLTATKIGEHFNLSNRKINLLFSELGWMENEKGGWISTPAGTKNGAIQMEASNGKPYVIWNSSILENKHLVREIKGASGEEEYQKEDQVINTQDDFRKKYPANFRTPDGHYVRSRAEVMIDDFLYKNGIVHAYERKLNIDEDLYCDFYLPSGKIYIEYWGLEENQRYQERKRQKLEIYAKYGFKLIELIDSDIENLEENLATKLRRYNITVD